MAMIIKWECHISTPPEMAAHFRRLLWRKFVRDVPSGYAEMLDSDGYGAWSHGAQCAEFDWTPEEFKLIQEAFLAAKRAAKEIESRAKKEGRAQGKNALIMLNTGEMSEAEFLKF